MNTEEIIAKIEKIESELRCLKSELMKDGVPKKDDGKKTENMLADELFEHLWELYPKKRGKTSVKSGARRALLKYNKSDLEKAIENYKEENKNTEYSYILNGSTFFNGRFYDYLPENYNNQSKEQPKRLCVNKNGQMVLEW